MLQQILRDLWIDPELLAELGDDQKQILFCKMREEQVRRWKIWDEQQKISLEPKEKTKVKFLLGEDGEPWTWVMGEHSTDKSIEQILEDEARERARRLAEEETQQLRKSVEAELTEILDMNQKEIEQLEAAQELNRLRQQNSPIVRKKHEKPENFSIKEFGKKEEKILKMNNGRSPPKVSAAVAQWEQKVMEERTSVIFCQLRKKQMEATMEAEDRAKKEESLWMEQEKKAKEAECQIREIARRAREEHRRSSYCENAENTFSEQKEPSSPSLPSPVQYVPVGAPVSTARPPNRSVILEWFRVHELNRRAAITDENKPEPWFHGLISRQEAEQALISKPVGSFLVRLSERIWGYAITYRDSDRCKHYLIDASNTHYKFLGTDQVCHQSLGALVKYHQSQPITILGGELLRHPCSPDDLKPSLLMTSITRYKYMPTIVSQVGARKNVLGSFHSGSDVLVLPETDNA